MARIFISYRRDDTAGYAGRLYDHLVGHFGEDSVFMDIDTIEPGADFIKVIEDAVSKCDVFLALIGKRWMTITNNRWPNPRPRLEDPRDFVRLEISIALRRNIRVIPVLVDGATMPSERHLPNGLKSLVHKNAFEIGKRWKQDVSKLIDFLETALTTTKQEQHNQVQFDYSRESEYQSFLEGEQLQKQNFPDAVIKGFYPKSRSYDQSNRGFSFLRNYNPTTHFSSKQVIKASVLPFLVKISKILSRLTVQRRHSNSVDVILISTILLLLVFWLTTTIFFNVQPWMIVGVAGVFIGWIEWIFIRVNRPLSQILSLWSGMLGSFIGFWIILMVPDLFSTQTDVIVASILGSIVLLAIAHFVRSDSIWK